MTTLDEAKYSAEQLRALLGKGQAIRNDNGDPSYPIADEEDLRKAIHAVGRGGSSHNKIRVYIIRRARALGKSDLIPDHWDSSGQMKETFAESIPFTEAVTGKPIGRMRIKLIDAGWGSSGYYGEAVLQQAVTDRIFPAGTQMYLDHPSASEAVERPERSVRDLAAVLTEETVYEGAALWNVARVFNPYQPVLNELKDHIGVSIRAAGIAEHGEAEGREGPIITALTEGVSVDFVTRAGRGGQIVEVLESARRQVEADPSLLNPDLSAAAEANQPAPPAQPTKEGAPVSGSTNPQGAPPSGGAPTQVSEALRTELAETKQKLAEAELKVAQLGDQSRDLEETKAKLAEAERTNLRLLANNAARDKAAETLAESTLPEVAHAKVIEAVTGVNVALNDDGALDEAALVKNIKAAIEAERTYLSRFAESAGMGQVRGLGGSSDGEVNVEAELDEVFKSIGMSESAAAAAAKGRA